MGRPTGKDVISGFVTGLFSIPEGMAYASIGGFNPVLGLYSGMAPTVVGAIFARTVLMTTTLTSAIALSSQSVLTQAGLDPTAPGNIAMLTVMVGAVMTIFGVLKLGSVMSFVSTAVMTGFTTGIALQIVAGVLKDATAYASQQSNTLLKIADWVIHIGQWQLVPTLVTIATIGVWALARLVPKLKPMATLIALAVITVGVSLLDLDVEKVADIASIPNALPRPSLPDLAAAPDLVVGAVAVALVALAQAAGIGAAVPNPDGSRTNVSRDFLAQGLANLAGGVTQALPTGGSLSRTGVATSAGARTRWSNIFAGLWLALIVLLVGHQAELIPMPVIGGLVMVIGIELVNGTAHEHHPGGADGSAVHSRDGGHLPRHHGAATSAGDLHRCRAVADPDLHKILARSGLIAKLGADNVVPATGIVLEAVEKRTEKESVGSLRNRQLLELGRSATPATTRCPSADHGPAG